jgi:hypothetical protein
MMTATLNLIIFRARCLTCIKTSFGKKASSPDASQRQRPHRVFIASTLGVSHGYLCRRFQQAENPCRIQMRLVSMWEVKRACPLPYLCVPNYYVRQFAVIIFRRV